MTSFAELERRREVDATLLAQSEAIAELRDIAGKRETLRKAVTNLRTRVIRAEHAIEALRRRTQRYRAALEAAKIYIAGDDLDDGEPAPWEPDLEDDDSDGTE